MSEQESLISDLLDMHRVNSIDDRGYYIVNGDGNCGGVYYLHNDGVIRSGVSSPSLDAFWPTEAEAWKFYFKWALENAKG